MSAVYKKVRSELEKDGLLLLTDAALPSLVSIIAGEPVKGSWWGHPKGKLMYNLSNELMDEENVLSVKLINGKVTFVHKKFWDALFAIGTAQEGWQIEKLLPVHKNLLETVTSKGAIRADDPKFKKSPGEIGKFASKLEERLLIYSDSIHTDSGKHVRLLKSWKKTMKDKRYLPGKIKYVAAIAVFEEAKGNLSSRYAAKVTLPWS